MNITCKYSCKECGLHRVEVQVQARPKDMDVIHWVQNVCGYTIAADHAFRSPQCKSNTMDEMMIPVSGAEIIGGPIVQ